MDKYECYNCKKISNPDDPDTNWIGLHKRNHKRLLGCDCGYGLYPGQITSLVASPDEVEDQKEQLIKAGVNLDKKKKAAKKK